MSKYLRFHKLTTRRTSLHSNMGLGVTALHYGNQSSQPKMSRWYLELGSGYCGHIFFSRNSGLVQLEQSPQAVRPCLIGVNSSHFTTVKTKMQV